MTNAEKVQAPITALAEKIHEVAAEMLQLTTLLRDKRFGREDLVVAAADGDMTVEGALMIFRPAMDDLLSELRKVRKRRDLFSRVGEMVDDLHAQKPDAEGIYFCVGDALQEVTPQPEEVQTAEPAEVTPVEEELVLELIDEQPAPVTDHDFQA